MKVQAPREKGKANRAVTTQLAQRLELPAHAIYLESGRSSTSKVVLIEALDELEIQRRINQITG